MKPFALVTFLGFAVLAFGGCSPSNSGNNAADNNAADNNNSALSNEAVSNAAIVPSTTSTPTPSERASLVSNVWVPGKDDRLHLQPVSKMALDAQKKYGNPTSALADIVRMAPRWFPPKTRVLQWHDDGKTVSVNLNRNFASSDFWSKSGEKTTELAVYALVNSASTDGKPVVLKVEMRPISEDDLNGFDASDAIEPNPKLQATGSATTKTNISPAKASAATQAVAPRATASATTAAAINALPDADFSSPKTGTTLPGKTGAR